MDLVSQNLLLTSGGKKDSTYVDDVFSTYLYTGNGTAQTIENGIKIGNANAGNSVGFDGSGAYLSIPYSSDYQWNNQSWTLEYWVNPNAFGASSNNNSNMVGYSAPGGGEYWSFGAKANGTVEWYYWSASQQRLTTTTTISTGQWTHLAFTYDGTTMTIWINGVSSATGAVQGTVSTLVSSGYSLGIGRVTNADFNGYISNVRITKGQALYTSNFTPSTEPFTTTSQGATASNVKLLCCNKDTVTGSDVTPGTITAFGVPTASNLGTGTASDGEGGMTWIKGRSIGTSSVINDTVRGAGNRISSNSNQGSASSTAFLKTFNNSGFSVGSDGDVNYNNQTFASWSFRKQKGFFDVVTYTGTGSARTVSHNLGSIPGCIMVKRTDGGSEDWVVYHCASAEYLPNNAGHYFMYLNTNDPFSEAASRFNNTTATSTEFSVGTDNGTNGNGFSYVAYVFAGGESTQNEAVSVDMDGTGDYINTTSSSSDFTMGTGDFTVEGWFKCDNDNTNRGLFQISPVSGGLTGTNFNNTISVNIDTSSYFRFNANGAHADSTVKCVKGQWYHVALVRNSGTSSLYLNGILVKSNTDPTDYNGTYIAVSGYWDFGYVWDGPISNFRVVKGTAVYTSSFRPPTKPLTNISGTVLLCCNDSSVTGSTVTPVTLNSQGDPTASTDSPFDDPEGFKFGEGGDQNLIKCGSYKGSTSADFEVNLGWEPQFIMFKMSGGGSANWSMFDSMRGIVTEGNENYLYPNLSNTEYTAERISLTPTGFIVDASAGVLINQNDGYYVYVAIRRPDPLVGKPAEAGTDAFAMSMGSSGNNSTPSFISGWPVNMGIMRRTDVAQSWYLHNRLTGQTYISPNTNGAETNAGTNCIWDSMTGFFKNQGTNVQGWMWKRGAGFDVVTYKGNGTTGHTISHSLNKSPEIIWVKNRTSGSNTGDWMVGFKDLYGGSSPWNGYLVLNKSQQQYNDNHPFNNYTPTAIDFQLNNWDRVNANGSNYVAMLFTSVNGISSCGSYAPSSSSTTVTCGFQPRFVIVKAITKDNTWSVADSLRGITAGNDPALALNENWENDKYGGADWIDVSATGFTVNSTGSSGTADANSSGETYIYYAHA